MNIEELAFKDRKILANLNAVDLLNIIEFLQGDRRQCLEELSKTHNRSVEIQKENQKYKEVIDKAIEYIKIYRSYQKIDNKDYLKGRDEIGCLDIYQVDELLDILKEVE